MASGIPFNPRLVARTAEEQQAQEIAALKRRVSLLERPQAAMPQKVRFEGPSQSGKTGTRAAPVVATSGVVNIPSKTTSVFVWMWITVSTFTSPSTYEVGFVDGDAWGTGADLQVMSHAIVGGGVDNVNYVQTQQYTAGDNTVHRKLPYMFTPYEAINFTPGGFDGPTPGDHTFQMVFYRTAGTGTFDFYAYMDVLIV